MWMAYRNYREIVDLKSGLKSLISKFSDLEFDAEHEAVYGFGRFETEENCLRKARSYRKGRRICRRYLKLKISSRQFCEEMKKLGHENYLDELLPFMDNFEYKADMKSFSGSTTSTQG